MDWIAIKILSALLLPPLNLIVLGVAGLALLKRRPVLGKTLLTLTLGLLYLFSTPLFSSALRAGIESQPLATLDTDAGAIVVLGGGTYPFAPEYGGDTVNRFTLERLRYAARLYAKTGKPILVSGGNPLGYAKSEGAAMREALEGDFGVPVKWVEEHSRNTWENARLSAPLLARAGVKKIYLVTHAWHMTRALSAFENTGLKVIPAGTGFATHTDVNALDFLPSAMAFSDTYLAMHEALGLLWYKLRA
ncbi:MAG: YdcF family protein [Burkholderiales bacterium]